MHMDGAWVEQEQRTMMMDRQLDGLWWPLDSYVQ